MEIKSITVHERGTTPIRILDPHPNSSPNFSKAKDQYIADYEGGEEFRHILDAIDMGKLEHVRTDFCELELSRQ